MKDHGLWFWPYESATTKDRAGQRIVHSEGVTEIKDIKNTCRVIFR